MTTIVNNDKLKIILTSYGLQRIAEALTDETKELNLFKIKVGDANGEYYEPSADQTSLVSPIEGGSFYIVEKELLEDGLTVSLKVVLPEKFGGYDIREIGIYETINNVDMLFAIGTQQPIVKPEEDDNYFISIDYYVFLKSASLSDVYNQIQLSPDNELATEKDFQDLLSTMLFAHGNIADQVNKNSHIIGMNRATELYELISELKKHYGYVSTAENYATLLNYVDVDDIFSYWVFDYPRKKITKNDITDIAKKGYNLSSNQAINLYERNYNGFMPFLNFERDNYFYLPSATELKLVDDENYDIPFTMIFAVLPCSTESKRTLLARSNYATHNNVFEVNELANGAIEIKLFENSYNYVTFTSSEGVVSSTHPHSLILIYDSANLDFTVLLNAKKITMNKVVTGSYNHMNTTPTTLYGYEYTPYQVIYADKSTIPVTTLYNSDGTVYDGFEWTLQEGTPNFNLHASVYNSSKNISTSTLYAWNYNDGINDHTIYTKETTITSNTTLYTSDYKVYDYKSLKNPSFSVVLSGTSYIVTYIDEQKAPHPTTYTSSKNIASKQLYAWVHTETTPEKIWTNSNTAPSILFTSDGDIYEGDKWSIVGTQVLYKNSEAATYKSANNIIIPVLEVASFITNASGQRDQFINSRVGLISILLKSLSEDEARTFALELEAEMGKNPCFSIY